jgi:hypothetical protein
MHSPHRANAQRSQKPANELTETIRPANQSQCADDDKDGKDDKDDRDDKDDKDDDDGNNDRRPFPRAKCTATRRLSLSIGEFDLSFSTFT